MKYYLVALFDDSSSSSLIESQKIVSKRYRLYKNTQVLHIPLGVINTNDFDKLDSLLSKIFNPYKKFKTVVDNNITFNDDFNSIGFRVEDKGYINKITRNIFDTLTLNGINIKPFNGSILNIPMANANHSVRKASNNSPLSINPKLSKDEIYCTGKIASFQIWKQPTSNKEIIKSYALKDY